MGTKGLKTQELVRFLIDPDRALTFHLQCIRYPPIHLVWLPVARQSIRLANKEMRSEVIKYPNGLERTVEFTIKGLHLETFLDS